MKSLLLLTLALTFLSRCDAQTKNADSLDQAKQISEQAEKMGQLLLKKEFKAFANFTYPKIVEMMGGQDQMIQILERGFKDMESQGISLLNISFGKHSDIIIHGGERQCVVPQKIEMKVPGGRLITNSTLIAISTDNGKNWYFIDTSGKDIQEMKRSLKNLSSELIIPEKQEPIFIKE